MFYKKYDETYSKVRFRTLHMRQETEHTFDFSSACHFLFLNILAYVQV